MTISYPARVSLARLPTPLEPLERLSREIGGPRLWVKRDDLTGVGVSGNKVRKLEFCVGEALAQECDTLITCGGLQSNHCRATAIVGAQLGLQVHLFLRGLPQGAPDGNLFWIISSERSSRTTRPLSTTRAAKRFLQNSWKSMPVTGARPL